MSTVTLTVGGTRYSGWQSIHISRGIEQVAGSFNLAVSEKFDGLKNPRPIKAGDKATVAIDGDVVITGHVDVVAPQYDAHQHTLQISGRDATGDLVDCAAVHKSGGWTNRTLAQIARDVAKPFGIGVKVETNVGKPIKSLTIEPGETALETLDRAARYRGVLLMSDGLGNLLLTEPRKGGAAPAALELGKNILSASGHVSLVDRFATYIVKAQQSGSDSTFGAAASGPSAQVVDAVMQALRYRPTVILCEDQASAADCKLRAEWQRTVAAARSRQVVYTVVGWRANMKLWQPNTTVPVTDAYLSLKETRLISQVDYTLDEQGARTELTCTLKHAYDVQTTPEPDPYSLGGF